MSSYQHSHDQETDSTGDPSAYYGQHQQAQGYYQYSEELPPEIYVEGDEVDQGYGYGYGYAGEEDEEPPTPTASNARHHRHGKKSSKDKGKGVSTSSGSSHKKRKEGKPAPIDSASDTEREISKKMSSRSSRHHQASSSSSTKKDKDKSKTKSDDWTEITEPEERRRIQNRIAQRKFREKAREQKDRAQRDAQNQQYADGSYRIPSLSEFPQDSGELSGLPWGGMDMHHVMTRGHGASSATSSPHGAGSRSGGARDVITTTGVGNPYFLSPYGGGYAPAATGGYYTSGSTAGDGGSSGEDPYYGVGDGATDESSPYYYDYDFDHSGA